MTQLLTLSLIVLLSLPIGSSVDAQSKTTKIFFLEDIHHKEWCAYANESIWKSSVDSLGAMTVGSLNYEKDQLAVVDVTEGDEAGDWMVYDHYTVDPRGEPLRDERKNNILPGRRSVEETYVIQNGKATRQSSSVRSLTTGGSLSDPEQWLPKVPVITHAKDFPFAALIVQKYPEAFSHGKVCVPFKRPGG
jgi:hypothetical protein